MKQLKDALHSWDPVQRGRELYDLVARLYPVCRSITGNGFRRSLGMLGEKVPMVLHEVPSGTQVFDWTVPNEWNIQEAWIKNAQGERILDFSNSNLHVVNYSTPVHQKMSLAELRPHLHSLPDAPDWIPYRTSYYRETWGFCLPHRQLLSLPEGEYEVFIDSRLEPGNLTYGELLIQGQTQDEVLISCHACHPSLCNDNLSGMAVAAGVARLLSDLRLRYSYRFLWIPGTIGSITWLARNEGIIPRIKHGLVLSCLGDSGIFNYKRSRTGKAEIDRAVEHVLQHSREKFAVSDFTPFGYDERQYNSPGINLPVGCLMRTPNGKYPEYHTSADNLSLVSPRAMALSTVHLLKVIEVIEGNARCLNLHPKCEPQLGRRGLYRQMGGTENNRQEQAMLWLLNLSDGGHSLLDIAERSGIEMSALIDVTGLLIEKGLLQKV